MHFPCRRSNRYDGALEYWVIIRETAQHTESKAVEENYRQNKKARRSQSKTETSTLNPPILSWVRLMIALCRRLPMMPLRVSMPTKIAQRLQKPLPRLTGWLLNLRPHSICQLYNVHLRYLSIFASNKLMFNVIILPAPGQHKAVMKRYIDSLLTKTNKLRSLIRDLKKNYGAESDQ